MFGNCFSLLRKLNSGSLRLRVSVCFRCQFLRFVLLSALFISWEREREREIQIENEIGKYVTVVCQCCCLQERYVRRIWPFAVANKKLYLNIADDVAKHKQQQQQQQQAEKRKMNKKNSKRGRVMTMMPHEKYKNFKGTFYSHSTPGMHCITQRRMNGAKMTQKRNGAEKGERTIHNTNNWLAGCSRQSHAAI